MMAALAPASWRRALVRRRRASLGGAFEVDGIDGPVDVLRALQVVLLVADIVGRLLGGVVLGHVLDGVRHGWWRGRRSCGLVGLASRKGERCQEADRDRSHVGSLPCGHECRGGRRASADTLGRTAPRSTKMVTVASALAVTDGL